MKKQKRDSLKSGNEVPVEISGSEPISKKDQILSLHASGMDNLEDIALMTNSRITYVASVLQKAGLITGYFDLYTTSSQPMNTYSRFFAGKLNFKDAEAANKSVALLDRLHRQFRMAHDRAGQHHALMMGLTMFNRARWTGKRVEAGIFRRWLMTHLNESTLELAVDELAGEKSPRLELSV